jgi:hypothetical protein
MKKCFLFLTVAVFTASMMLSGCNKDKDGDGDEGDFPTEKLAKWGLTIQTPAGYKAKSASSYETSDYGYTAIVVNFDGNASTYAAVKKAFTDSGWTDPNDWENEWSVGTTYSKTGYDFGSLIEDKTKDGARPGFEIKIQKPR